MELTPLKYFVKLADVLSFTKASKELFITQSTLSISIKQLEEELGVALFDRIGKKIFLTDAGREFSECSRTAIEEVSRGVRRLREMQRARAEKVRVGVAYGLFPLLNACVLRFAKTFPRSELSIVHSQSVSELSELLHSGNLDFALTYRPQDMSSLAEVGSFGGRSLCVVAHESHPAAVRKHFSLPDLDEFPVALLCGESQARKAIDRMLSRYRIKAKPQVEVNSTHLLLEMLRTGHWISILPQDAAAGCPDLKTVPIKEKAETAHVSLISLKGKSLSPSAEKFLEVMRSETQRTDER